jgi:dGTPase
LAGVTQVVNPTEGHVFHNRLTHTMKVAQIARRLAQRLWRDEDNRELAANLGGLDPAVVEAAALAHDLGHPPFGHIAERRLNSLVFNCSDRDKILDGYEGNAQSLRILTRLAVQGWDMGSFPSGLNLTYATLNAVIKYPRFQEATQDKLGNIAQVHNKWGAYQTEAHIFHQVRTMLPDDDSQRSLEAEIMDWADDITYAIHDMEDFFRAGLIPLSRLLPTRPHRMDTEQVAFIENLRQLPVLLDKGYAPDDITKAFEDLSRAFPREPFSGSRDDRAHLINMTSQFIKKYVGAIHLNKAATERDERKVTIDRRARLEVHILQHLTRYYVIDNPALASQQAGEMRIIDNLFDYFFDASSSRWLQKRFPSDFRELLLDELDRHKDTLGEDVVRARVVADKISSMTDEEAVKMYRRITGHNPGSVFDRL